MTLNCGTRSPLMQAMQQVSLTVWWCCTLQWESHGGGTHAPSSSGHLRPRRMEADEGLRQLDLSC